MGNSPSTSKPATPTQHHHHIPGGHAAHGGHAGHDSPRANKKEPKNLISAHQHQHRSAASSPEASVIQAQGSTIGPKGTHSRPLSTFNSSSPSGSSQTSTAPRTPATRQKQVDADECPPNPAPKNEPSKPVAVPTATSTHTASSSLRSSQYEDSLLNSGPTSSSAQDMSYVIGRPPRLPLPIEEEVHTPGSPIIAPADIGEPLEELGKEDGPDELQRKSSGISNATDEEDNEELRVDKTRPTVPTRIEWLEGGQKVYVTGTPFQWSRKQRLLPAKGREGVLEAIIPVFPGTHHIKFLVDGAMETSTHLPTTVDFGNNLVNYIEVSGDDAAVRNIPVGATPPKDGREAQRLPSRCTSEEYVKEAKPQQKKTVPIPPPEKFSSHLPQYLADFDQPEDSRPYQLSVGALDKLPMPPGLPSFLTKPIMNNTTLIKDDNSVLNMPNHTVLNHLATSSIKNNVLAVSATTRYMNKYVTTIIYKPTSEDS